jgi:hypothetical protein
MGHVIDFPVEQRLLARPVTTADTGTVIILPVVRVERAPELPSDVEPGSGATPGRKRRRRRAF